MKKLRSFIKSNTKLFIGFILGAIIFGSIGAVVAGTVASSEITYTNNGQTTVEGAINDLYGKAAKIPVDYYEYWTDNYSDDNYSSTSVPSTVYASYTNLVTPGTDKPFIRTTYMDGSPIKHSACLYLGSNGKVFCLEHNYWKTITGTNDNTDANREAVKQALNAAMEEALDTSTTSCESNSHNVQCFIGQNYCTVDYGGFVNCFAGMALGCSVTNDGRAVCTVY